jgi:hypothetical protein
MVTLAEIDAEIARRQPARPMQPLGRTVLDQGVQGATFGFGDEVQDRIGAAIASLAGSGSYDDMLKEARGMSRDRLSQQFEQRPVASILSNLAGGLATGAAGTATKTGSAIANSLRSGNAAARIGKGALAGATSGALFGAGTAEDDNRAEGAGQGALLGAAFGAALPALGAVGGAAKNALFNKGQQTTSEEIRKLANQAYKTAETQGGTLTPKFTNQFIAETDKVMPQTEAGRLLAGDNPVTKIVEKIKSLKDRPLSLSEAQEIDEFLGDTIDQFTELGRVTKQGKKLLDVQSSFRNMIEGAAPGDIQGGTAGFDALKEGRKLWSSAARLRDVEKIISRAEMTDNPATAIKTGFRNLYNNPARMRGFNDSEKELIKKASETGVVGDTLRVLGSRLIPIVTAGSGGGLGATAASQAATMASRGAATKMQLNRATKLADEIANNALKTNAPPQMPNNAVTPLLSAPAGALAELETQAPSKGVSALPAGTVPFSINQIDEEIKRREAQAQQPQEQSAVNIDAIPLKAIDKLLKRPHFAPDFDAKYGAGSAEKVLGIVQPPEPAQAPMQMPALEPEVSPIEKAAQIAGEDADLLNRFAFAESRLNPEATNPDSSAAGLFQITKPTWMSLVSKRGKEHGIGMGDVMKPEANALMAAYLVKENREMLSKDLKRSPSDGELYLAHFFGPKDAVKLIKATPFQNAAMLFPKAAKSNKSVFYNGSRPRTVAEVYQLLTRKV